MKKRFMENISQERKSFVENKEVFRENYVPDELLYRSQELNELAEYLSEFFNKGENPEKPKSIVGESGTGKTAMVRFIQETFDDECNINGAHMVYVNCKKNFDKYKLFKRMAQNIDNDIPESGYSAEDYFDKTLEKVREKNGSVVLILDEVDFLYKKGGLQDFDDVMYYLGDIDEVTPVFVSNEPDWKDVLEDVRTSKRSGTDLMNVYSYKRKQLAAIMKKRAEEGLKSGVLSDEVFELMVDLISEEYSDARKAIDLLYSAAKAAERSPGIDEIKKSHVESAFDKMESSGKTRFMKRFAVQKKLVMTALESLLVKKNDDEGITAGKIHEEYLNVLEVVNKLKRKEFGEDVKEYRERGLNSTYRRLREFESYGLIEKEENAVDSGEGRKKDKIIPMIDPSVYFQKIQSGDLLIDTNMGISKALAIQDEKLLKELNLVSKYNSSEI